MNNIGILLSAGKSTRFDSTTPKQLYNLNGKPIINHSIDLLSKYLDDLVIVTNSDCQNFIQGNILINDSGTRLESIKLALDKITNCDNVLIHDAARPFITDSMIVELIKSSENHLHSQFVLPLINGLVQKTKSGFITPDRQDFLELCSPQITNYDLIKFAFERYINKDKECEILPIVSKFGLSYNLIEGHYKYLRKVTTLDDII